LRTTETQTKNACLPEVPPEAMPAAPAAPKARQTNISSLDLTLGWENLNKRIYLAEKPEQV
jgi:hypothetical protein